jgi:hypothetical protein
MALHLLVAPAITQTLAQRPLAGRLHAYEGSVPGGNDWSSSSKSS